MSDSVVDGIMSFQPPHTLPAAQAFRSHSLLAKVNMHRHTETDK